MAQPVDRDVSSIPFTEKEDKAEWEEKLCSEFTAMTVNSVGPPMQATTVPKHSLHGLFTGSTGDGAQQGTDASKEVPTEGGSVEDPSCPRSSDFNLLAELGRLAKLYGVEGCVLALAEEAGSVRVLEKYGLEFEARQCNQETRSGFKFFRHHVPRNLPIIIADTRKRGDLEGHPLVVAGPRIAFYAATPLIVGQSTIVGTLSLIDSRPRNEFSLEDCEALQRVAGKLAQVISRMR